MKEETTNQEKLLSPKGAIDKKSHNRPANLKEATVKNSRTHRNL